MMRKHVTDEQYGKLRRRTDEVVRRVVEGTLEFKETMFRLQELIEDRLEIQQTRGPSVTSYPGVPVDYAIRPSDDFSKSFDLVSEGYAEGNDWQRDERCRDVPTNGFVQLTFELVQFNKVVKTQEVLEALDAQVLRPATLEELVSFTGFHPELQREFYIVGLGSACSWDAHRYVPYLTRSGIKRSLNLRWGGPDNDWSEEGRFLAVSK